MNVTLILGVTLIVVGGAMILFAQIANKRAEAAQAWPVVQGKVESTEVKRHSSHNPKTHHTTVSYIPVVNYSYTVEGSSYKGSKLTFGSSTYDSTTAHNIVDQYSTGSSVGVHYDPKNPAKAVLEVKAVGTKMNLIVGIVFAALGVVLIALSY